MKRIAQFEKVSLKQFTEDWLRFWPDDADETIEEIYENIILPERATSGSAGYDFFLPMSVEISPGETLFVPTGIRVKIDEGWVLKLYPRSSLGIRYRIQLDNTVGIIDSDYYNSSNEGHIMIMLTNDSKESAVAEIASGKGYLQGIFVQYGITYDDDVMYVRNGGFGSTD